MVDAALSDAVDVTLKDKDDRLHIPNFEVLPDDRRRKHGTRTMKRILQLAETYGHSKVTIEMRLTNPNEEFADDPSVQFLDAMGFQNLTPAANGKHVTGEYVV